MSNYTVAPALAPWVELLGLEGAVELVLAVGGVRLYVPRVLEDGGQLARLVGPEVAARLIQAMPGDRVPVPVCRGWMAGYLREVRGWTVSEIARVLKTTERGVYKALSRRDGRQMELFGR